MMMMMIEEDGKLMNDMDSRSCFKDIYLMYRLVYMVKIGSSLSLSIRRGLYLGN